MAPPNTAMRSFRILKTAAMKNVLSPISVAMMAENEAKSALRKAVVEAGLSNLNLSLRGVPVPPRLESIPRDGDPLPLLALAAAAPPPVLPSAPIILLKAMVYSTSLME